jgi:hypothetical protein
MASGRSGNYSNCRAKNWFTVGRSDRCSFEPFVALMPSNPQIYSKSINSKLSKVLGKSSGQAAFPDTMVSVRLRAGIVAMVDDGHITIITGIVLVGRVCLPVRRVIGFVCFLYDEHWVFLENFSADVLSVKYGCLVCIAFGKLPYTPIPNKGRPCMRRLP